MKKYESDDDLVNDIKKLPQSYKLSSESRHKIISAIRDDYQAEQDQQGIEQTNKRAKTSHPHVKATLMGVAALFIVSVIGVASWHTFMHQPLDRSASPQHQITKDPLQTDKGAQNTKPKPSIQNKGQTHSNSTVQNQNHKTLQSVKAQISKIDMTTAQLGWIQAGNQVLYTKDGGKTWDDVTPKAMPKNTSNHQVESKVFIADSKHAFLVVSTNKGSDVYRTADRGKTWSKSTLPTTKFSQGINMPVTLVYSSTNEAWLMNSEGGAAGSEGVIIYHTTDQGRSWQVASETNPQRQSKKGLPFGGHKSGIGVYQKTLWLTGGDASNQLYLYKSTDAGKSWTYQSLPIPKGYSANGGAALTEPPVFFSQNDGVLPVHFYMQSQPYIFYVTHDGGKTWQTGAAVKPTDRHFFYQILDAKHIIGVDTNKVVHSSNQGQSWKTTSQNQALNGIHFINQSVGFGYQGKTIYKTTDGGVHWQVVNK